MVVRVVGLKEETSYGTAQTPFTPDWHKYVTKSSFALNDEPILFGEGSRMNNTARPGIIKPTGTVESRVDLKTIGHLFKAFLDQYQFTADTGSAGNENIHEFWGAESSSLTSFTGVSTFDVMAKYTYGMMLDSLKLEVSDEAMTSSEEWIYKTQKIIDIDENSYDVLDIEDAIPVMFYDVAVQLAGANPPGVNSSFSFEGKNNLNVDATVGLGSRAPQIKARAQKREITMSLVTTLRPETVDMIKKVEHGEVRDTPSECKICKMDMKVIIAACENAHDRCEITFPQSTLLVEYEGSESDEIEATFNLTALGNGNVTLNDGTRVNTDMYVKLVNNQDEIISTATTPSTPSTPGSSGDVQGGDS